MKLLIASDIHGFVNHCRELADAITRENPDRVLLLGDLIGGHALLGTCEEFADTLNAFADRITGVRGNCDSQEEIALFKFPISNYATLKIGDRTAVMFHGHKPLNYYSMPPGFEADIYLSGHTHIPSQNGFFGKVNINPGSVSLPRGNSKCSYVTFEDGTFWFKTLQGEVFDRCVLN